MGDAGRCPVVKALYDANRYVEFKDGSEAPAAVGFTGEIQGMSAGCTYKGGGPIQVAMDILFEFGKGPQAQGNSKTYRYWVAVTDRNREVIAKQEFELTVTFPSGKDRVYVTDNIRQITIPRGAMTTSGANFEVLRSEEHTTELQSLMRIS